MASQEQPDLTSVLQTLASYSQPKQPNQHGIALNPTIPFAGSQNVSHPFNGQTIKPKSQESIPRVDGGAIRPTIDPRTITTWPPALRYVMQAVAQNKETMDRVRHLIKLQHDHEKEWFSGRQRVVEMQKQRVVGGKRVDEILYVDLSCVALH